MINATVVVQEEVNKWHNELVVFGLYTVSFHTSS